MQQPNLFDKVANILTWTAACAAVGLLAACSSTPVRPADPAKIPAPIRFVLSFDDGPASSQPDGPTASILRDLADNPAQPGIKAVFFLQTRAAGAGGSERGRALMHQEFEAGHVLAFHTATPRHANHRYLDPSVFEQSLDDGAADIRAVTGAAPQLVRPPFWSFDERTFAAYQAHGMHILLTDLSANDGKIYGVNFSLRRRSSMLHQMDAVRARIEAGALPVVDGAIPVVVTFHDINPYTARHLREYLQILEDSARELKLPLADKPFYDDHETLLRAALARTVSDPKQHVELPGLWGWIWSNQ